MKYLKTAFIVLLTSVCAASAVRAQTPAETRLYVEPSVVYGFLGGAKDTAGAAIAAGAEINQKHLIGAEFIYLPFKANYNTSIKITPLLASYRYRLPIGQSVAFHVGACVGATFERASYYYGTQSATAFTVGALVDVSFSLTKNVSLFVGYKALGLSNTSITTRGTTSVLDAGLNIRF